MSIAREIFENELKKQGVILKGELKLDKMENEVKNENKINALIEATKLAIAEAVENELYLPMKSELATKNITHTLGHKKERFKDKVEQILDELKKDLMSKEQTIPIQKKPFDEI